MGGEYLFLYIKFIREFDKNNNNNTEFVKKNKLKLLKE